MNLPVYPFDPDLSIGTISEVTASTAKANLPRAASPEGQWQHGHKHGGGDVGAFVVIECGQDALFGRIVTVRLPERERLSVEPELGRSREVHPVGTIQLLSTISLRDKRITGGITSYPRLGARVYGAHPLLVQWIAETAYHPSTGAEACVAFDLATIPSADRTPIALTPERLFGRHCAVLGTTGGGKSWTVARLIEQASRFGAKIALLDATGEFYTLQDHVRHVQLGDGVLMPSPSTAISFPYSDLKEEDLLALFKPSGQTQAPKLRAAMRSLKVARAIDNQPPLVRNGLIKKQGQLKRPFLDAYRQHLTRVEGPAADFDVTKLVAQIAEECVEATGRQGGELDASRWGRYNENERSYCVSLLTRIEDMLQSPEFDPVFHPGERPSFRTTVSDFLADRSVCILRISLKYLSFAHDARPVVANAMGREFLRLAREGFFGELPLVVVLDEAHQFLGRILGDEHNRYPLDAFDLMAKEGRKYGLTVCLATQRPRDIPEGVLSQMGTLLVHRLINDHDRQVVERASGEIDRSAAAFLPTLAPGQAVLIGVDFPIPLTIQIRPPAASPASHGPDYQQHWPERARVATASAGAGQAVSPLDQQEPDE